MLLCVLAALRVTAKFVFTRLKVFAGKKYLNYHDFIPYAPPPCEELFVTRPFATFHVLEMTWKRLGWVGVQYHPEGTEEGVDWLTGFVKSSLSVATSR